MTPLSASGGTLAASSKKPKIMRRILIITTLLFALVSFSQERIIDGNWKVISVKTNNFYYNVANESFTLLNENDAAKVDKETIKKTYSNYKFSFNQGKLNQSIDNSVVEEFRYEIDQSEIKLSDLSIDFLSLHINYKLLNNQLHLYLPNKEELTELVLDKIN